MKKVLSAARGFSLAEMLIAASVGVIVVLAALNLLVELGHQDSELQVSAFRKEELQRALSFMQMEARMSYSISTANSSMPSQSTLATLNDNVAQPDADTLNQCSSAGRTPILGLTIRRLQENISGQYTLYTYGVIYSLESLKASGSDIWRGPYIIYRCGPEMLLDGGFSRCGEAASNDGSHSKCSDALLSKANNFPGLETHGMVVYGRYPVVDGISATPGPPCPSNPPSNRLPTTISTLGGFIACVQVDGRSVQLFLTGSAHGKDLPPIVGSAAARSL